MAGLLIDAADLCRRAMIACLAQATVQYMVSNDRIARGLMPFHIGLLVFPAITQLDMTGPYEVFISLPDTQVHLVWKSRDFIRRQAKGARYVTSVCTGALVLGAAGLLKGKRAATHWMSRDMLTAFGAPPVAERVVIDGNVITG